MTSSIKKISLAIQGGGSHEAFVWGVLDGLLEDGRIAIEGISGTSGGGLNALACLQGVAQNGAQGARQTLKEFWQQVSELSALNPCQPPFSDRMVGHFGLENSLSYSLFYQMIMNLSPYQWNPMNFNPLDFLVRHFFDFDKMNQVTEMKVFLCATHIRSGKLKIFSNPHLSAEAAMASACIPFLFQAVSVSEEYYWDGGFIANPAIYPLIDNCDCSDVIVVQLTKTHREELPKTRADITDRLKEITYNGCLVHEMRAIYFITKLIDEGKIKEGTLKRVNTHVIKNEDSFKNLNLSSALNTDWEFLMMLHNEGRKAADKWINDHFDKVGTKQHSIDESMFRDFVS